jgi:heat shock protein HtpX
VLSLFVVFGVVALLLGLGAAGLLLALVLSGAIGAGCYLRSDAVALRLARARPASPDDYPRLHNLVEGLCVAGGLTKPRLYIIDDPAPNAFTAGRSPRHASVAVTAGLLERLTRIELEGVLAHELSRVKSDDVGLCTLAVTMVGGLTALSDLVLAPSDGTNPAPRSPSLLRPVGVVLLGAAPVSGRLMRVVVGWRRHSLADLSGVRLTRYPPGLLAALEKLDGATTVVSGASRAIEHLWLCQPLAGEEAEGRLGRVNRHFVTHPPLEERIAALREL